MASIRRMDDKEFRTRLSEVAEWKLPDTPRETSLNQKKKRGRKSNEERYEEEHEQVFLELFDGVNPTYAPMLTKVKRCATNCDDCGEHCANGRNKEAKLQEKNGKTVWRQKCLTCNKFQNPFNGKFELTGQAASIKWNDFMRETKGAYKTAGNEKRKAVLVKEKTKTTFENERETITFYHDYKQQT
jgi:hypothetical protein